MLGLTCRNAQIFRECVDRQLREESQEQRSGRKASLRHTAHGLLQEARPWGLHKRTRVHAGCCLSARKHCSSSWKGVTYLLEKVNLLLGEWSRVVCPLDLALSAPTKEIFCCEQDEKIKRPSHGVWKMVAATATREYPRTGMESRYRTGVILVVTQVQSRKASWQRQRGSQFYVL